MRAAPNAASRCWAGIDGAARKPEARRCAVSAAAAKVVPRYTASGTQGVGNRRLATAADSSTQSVAQQALRAAAAAAALGGGGLSCNGNTHVDCQSRRLLLLYAILQLQIMMGTACWGEWTHRQQLPAAHLEGDEAQRGSAGEGDVGRSCGTPQLGATRGQDVAHYGAAEDPRIGGPKSWHRVAPAEAHAPVVGTQDCRSMAAGRPLRTSGSCRGRRSGSGAGRFAASGAGAAGPTAPRPRLLAAPAAGPGYAALTTLAADAVLGKPVPARGAASGRRAQGTDSPGGAAPPGRSLRRRVLCCLQQAGRRRLQGRRRPGPFRCALPPRSQPMQGFHLALTAIKGSFCLSWQRESLATKHVKHRHVLRRQVGSADP